MEASIPLEVDPSMDPFVDRKCPTSMLSEQREYAKTIVSVSSSAIPSNVISDSAGKGVIVTEAPVPDTTGLAAESNPDLTISFGSTFLQLTPEPRNKQVGNRESYFGASPNSSRSTPSSTASRDSVFSPRTPPSTGQSDSSQASHDPKLDLGPEDVSNLRLTDETPSRKITQDCEHDDPPSPAGLESPTSPSPTARKSASGANTVSRLEDSLSVESSSVQSRKTSEPEEGPTADDTGTPSRPPIAVSQPDTLTTSASEASILRMISASLHRSQISRVSETGKKLELHFTLEYHDEHHASADVHDAVDVVKKEKVSPVSTPLRRSPSLEAQKVPQLSDSNVSPEHSVDGYSTQDEADDLVRKTGASEVFTTRYTTEVQKSWIPNNLLWHQFSDIATLITKKPADCKGYIYVYCHAREKQVTCKETKKRTSVLDYTLPKFRRADGNVVSITAALVDNDEDPPPKQRKSTGLIKKQTPRTLRIKIGRSVDVRRRLKDHKRNCNHQPMLLLLYGRDADAGPLTNPEPIRHHLFPTQEPHGPDESPTRLANAEPTDHRWKSFREATPQVPYVEAVEKLIFASLEERSWPNPCRGCPRKHQEWFQIPDTVEAIQEVDAVIRRWIAWAKSRRAFAADGDGW